MASKAVSVEPRLVAALEALAELDVETLNRGRQAASRSSGRLRDSQTILGPPRHWIRGVGGATAETVLGVGGERYLHHRGVGIQREFQRNLVPSLAESRV